MAPLPKHADVVVSFHADTTELELALDNIELRLANADLRGKLRRARGHVDRLAGLLAAEYTRAEGLKLQLEEVTARMGWYRAMYHDASNGSDISRKTRALVREHRLNSVG